MVQCVCVSCVQIVHCVCVCVCVQVPQSELGRSTLVLQVFDFNRFTKHDIIGELRLPLGEVDWNHVIEEWRDLGEASDSEVRSGR